MCAAVGSRAPFGPSPCEYLKRFQDRQQRVDQFSEDIKKVITGPVPTHGGGGAQRNLSPGLRAGASLMFGGTSASCPSTSSSHAGSDATRDSRNARLQAIERSRRFDCPFDDHQSLGVAKTDLGDRKPRFSAPPVPPSPCEARAAYQAMHSRGKYIRDIHQKVGAGAPFDAPESHGPALSSSAVAASTGLVGNGDASSNAVPGSTVQASSIAEATSEAQRYKTRMRGCQDLIAGNYMTGDLIKARRPGSLPPRPGMSQSQRTLLPEAQMKVAYDGGSVACLSDEKVSYLNAKVGAEANRDRNGSRAMSGLLQYD
eukprot:TRINITY_DN18015_c0_g1_i3.p1 TRINITY_DN18015_c0_g1~~TRINITY_DN18015_c0_g1_i3.p1  ORF type:complete len:314 (-),score=49.41 TRINITY_DN18015_c0_g1_i3:234-1175(-)